VVGMTVQSITRVWSRIETVLIAILILAALIVFLGGAAIRALLPSHAIDWAEEVSLYCIIWATVLSGSTLVAEGRHISTEVFVARLSPQLQRLFGWGVTILVAGFCAVMAYYGWKAVGFAILLDERSASSLRVKQAYALFLALPVGMVLILGRIGLLLAGGERPFGEVRPPGPGIEQR
jgi:TRAP-type C4-dicarboxylate transport system permease small subunit